MQGGRCAAPGTGTAGCEGAETECRVGYMRDWRTGWQAQARRPGSGIEQRCHGRGSLGRERVDELVLRQFHFSSRRARLDVLERALVAGLRADDPEVLRQIAASLQDDVLDAAAPHATVADRAGFSQQRRRIAAQNGAPIIPDAPDRLM